MDELKVDETTNGDPVKVIEDDNSSLPELQPEDSEGESFQGWDIVTTSEIQQNESTSSEHDYSVDKNLSEKVDVKNEKIEFVMESDIKKKAIPLEEALRNKLVKMPIQLKNLKPCNFKCIKCQNIFLSITAYQTHAASCDFVKCPTCSEWFAKEKMSSHAQVHNSYYCEECGKCLGSQIGLRSHMRNVHPKETYMCQYCEAPMKTLNALQNHVKHAHPEKTNKDLQRFPCDRCPKRYEKKTSLERHKKWHDNIRDFHCDYCYKSFFTSNELLSHTRLMHSTEETFFCKICGKGFVRSDYLRRHEAYHVKYESSSCSVCKKMFRSEAKLMYHMQAGHTEDGVSLEEPKEVNIDAKLRNPPKMPGQYKTKCVCKICKKVIANPFGLRVHYKSHLKLKSFKCAFCGVLLQSPISLKRHEELHKDPNYKFACKICHARKNSEAELEYHVLTVHKTKRYKCHLCSEAFGRRYLLDSHQATEHADEIMKREMILEELSKETMYLDPRDDHNALYRGPKNNKGTRVGVDDSEINEICDKVAQNEYTYTGMIEDDDDDDEGAIVSQILETDHKEGQTAAENLQISQDDLNEINQHGQPVEFIALKQEQLDDGVQMVQDLGDGEYAIIDTEEQLAQLKTEAGEGYAYITTDGEEGEYPDNQVVGYVEGDDEAAEVREITEEEYQQLIKEGKYLVYEDEHGNTVTLEAPTEEVGNGEATSMEEEMEIEPEPIEKDISVRKEEKKEEN